ncbi:MAG: endolytic transglycosylase MltG [Candidatus Paceibacterota bacterium]
MDFFKTHVLWIGVVLCAIVLIAGGAYHYRRIIFPPPIPPPIRVTFVEGITVQKAAEQVASMFPAISAGEFISAGGSSEGYLFPDTYFFSSSTDATTIVKKMRDNFDTRIASLSGEILASGHSLSDIVNMAAIIEKEARTNEDRHIVAGILWKRLALGMPLQVDAAPDTYTHTGFPPAPICNPGLDALETVLNPTKTDFLYYLTGKDGLMHYAKTYAVHQTNIRKYLR